MNKLILFFVILLFSCEFNEEEDSNTLYINQIKYNIDIKSYSNFGDQIVINLGSITNGDDYLSLIFKAHLTEDATNWENKNVTLHLGRLLFRNAEDEENAFTLNSVSDKRVKGEFNFIYKEFTEPMHVYGKFDLELTQRISQ